jgi:hypothetical protein
MSDYLKCSWCGKETDSRDSRPWIQVMHLSCREQWAEKEGWEKAANGSGDYVRKSSKR